MQRKETYTTRALRHDARADGCAVARFLERLTIPTSPVVTRILMTILKPRGSHRGQYILLIVSFRGKIRKLR